MPRRILSFAASCPHGLFTFQEYLSASPLIEEEFYERGVRRLNSDEVLMPSGRVLQATATVSRLHEQKNHL